MRHPDIPDKLYNFIKSEGTEFSSDIYLFFPQGILYKNCPFYDHIEHNKKHVLFYTKSRGIIYPIYVSDKAYKVIEYCFSSLDAIFELRGKLNPTDIFLSDTFKKGIDEIEYYVKEGIIRESMLKLTDITNEVRKDVCTFFEVSLKSAILVELPVGPEQSTYIYNEAPVSDLAHSVLQGFTDSMNRLGIPRNKTIHGTQICKNCERPYLITNKEAENRAVLESISSKNNYNCPDCLIAEGLEGSRRMHTVVCERDHEFTVDIYRVPFTELASQCPKCKKENKMSNESSAIIAEIKEKVNDLDYIVVKFCKGPNGCSNIYTIAIYETPSRREILEPLTSNQHVCKGIVEDEEKRNEIQSKCECFRNIGHAGFSVYTHLKKYYDID